MMFLNIFFIIGVVFCTSTRKDILVTKLKKQEALSLLTKPIIFNKYLDIVKATDIIAEVIDNDLWKTPQFRERQFVT